MLDYIAFRAQHMNQARAAGRKISKEKMSELWASYKSKSGMPMVKKTRKSSVKQPARVSIKPQPFDLLAFRAKHPRTQQKSASLQKPKKARTVKRQASQLMPLFSQLTQQPAQRSWEQMRRQQKRGIPSKAASTVFRRPMSKQAQNRAKYAAKMSQFQRNHGSTIGPAGLQWSAGTRKQLKQESQLMPLFGQLGGQQGMGMQFGKGAQLGGQQGMGMQRGGQQGMGMQLGGIQHGMGMQRGGQQGMGMQLGGMQQAGYWF